MPPRAADPAATLSRNVSAIVLPSVTAALSALPALDADHVRCAAGAKQDAERTLASPYATEHDAQRVRAAFQAAHDSADLKLNVLNDARKLVAKYLDKIEFELELADGDAAAATAASVAPSVAPRHGAPVTFANIDQHMRFCLCAGVSHGQMVCCDNDFCAIEWFHFGCVGLAEAPDFWLCPICSELPGVRNRVMTRLGIVPSKPSKPRAGSPAGGRGRGGAGASSSSGGGGRGPVRAAAALSHKAKAAPSKAPTASHKAGGGGLRGGGLKSSKKGVTMSPLGCPACRGKHKAHTCGKGRNAMLAAEKLAAADIKPSMGSKKRRTGDYS